MANQNAKQDDNQFQALIAHSGTAGTAETRRVVVSPEGGIYTSGVEYDFKVDTESVGTVYYGETETPGTTSSANWKIQKFITVGGTLTSGGYADGNHNFDNVNL